MTVNYRLIGTILPEYVKSSIFSLTKWDLIYIIILVIDSWILATSEFGTWTFIFSLITVIIIVTTFVHRLVGHFLLNRKPNIEFTVRKNPLEGEKKEEGLTEFRIPSNSRIILYFVVKVEDKRHYRDSHAWIKFPSQFDVDHHTNYDDLEWGKGVIKRTKHQIGYKVETPLTNRKLLDAVYFPVIVNTPKTLGDYSVNLQFWSESIKSDSVFHEVRLKVVENNFSHAEKFFNPDTFRM